MSRVFPSLEESGLDLLRGMLQYDPARRLSVSALTVVAVVIHWVHPLHVCVCLSVAMSPVVCRCQGSSDSACSAAESCGKSLTMILCHLQAKDALSHPYFDDMDKAAVDALENPELENFADY